MFRTEAGELKRVMSLLGRFIPKRHTMPVLSCVRVCWGGGNVEWSATDLDGWLTVNAPAQADGEGVACIPHRVLADIAGRVDGMVEFAPDGEQVILRAGRARFTLNTIPAESYPERPQRGANLATVPAQTFARALKKVAPFCAEEYSRPALTAVCWNGGAMVATDGTRLAVCEGVPTIERMLLLGGQAMQVVAGLLPDEGEVHVFQGEAERVGLVVLTWTDGQCEYLVATRQVAAQYPDWSQVIPKSEPKLVATLWRDDLIGALRRLAVFGREDKFPVVTLRFERGGLTVQASGEAGNGQEEVACEDMVGEGLTVRANANLVLDGLRLAESDVVEMRGWGAEMIQEIREAGKDGWCYYWLPLRGGN